MKELLLDMLKDESLARNIVKRSHDLTTLREYIESIDPIVDGKCKYNVNRVELIALMDYIN